MTKLKDYEVTEGRFIGGALRKVGDLLPMTERAAKYYTSPYGQGLKLAKPAKKAAEKTPKQES